MLIFALTLSVVCAYLIISPWTMDDARIADNINFQWQDLEVKKEQILQTLKDLELDFATKKIASDDFKNQKNLLTKELSVLYAALDSLIGLEHSNQ